jgi:hypothetical protein
MNNIVYKAVRESIMHSLKESVFDSIGKSLRIINSDLRHSVWDSAIWHPVWHDVGDSTRDYFKRTPIK